jgi:hypothetical protein
VEERSGQQALGAVTGPGGATSDQRYAVAASLDHTLFSGYSLRAGCTTSAAMAGADDLFRGNVPGSLGL